MNVIIPVFENGVNSGLLENPNYLTSFKGQPKEEVLYIDQNGDSHYLIGLGKEKNEAKVILALRSFFFRRKQTLKGDVTIKIVDEEVAAFVREISQGIHLGKYDIGNLKEEKIKDWYSGNNQIKFEGKYKQEAVSEGKMLAYTQMKLMHWGDAPANYKTPQILANWIKESGAENGFAVELYDAAACEKMGLHALLAVGRGSIENPPMFCVLKYSHPNAKTTVGLVGKGVTFDTGGVSLKPGNNMNYMKSDMGGAAAVAGTVEMAANLKLPVNIVAAIPLTENCIDSFAIKPGDVIKSYAGKTIEVINTDAEGRLILADGLAYIKKNFETDVLIDLATLTGNAIMALGNKAAALVSPNDELANALFSSGLKTGEKVWRMPHWEEYNDSLKSDIADLKNLAASPAAGAINAAKFLEVFTDKHPAWAHLDIAGTAFGDSEFGSMKSATGYGVRLLIDYLRGLK